jgi:hypothetical protein
MPNTSSSVPFLLSSSMNSIRSRRPSACLSSSPGSGLLQQLGSGMVRQLTSQHTANGRAFPGSNVRQCPSPLSIYLALPIFHFSLSFKHIFISLSFLLPLYSVSVTSLFILLCLPLYFAPCCFSGCCWLLSYILVFGSKLLKLILASFS